MDTEYKFKSQQLHIWSISLLMHLGKSAADGPSPWGPCTHVGDSKEALGSWFQPGPASASATFWGVNQWMIQTNFFFG